MYVVGHRGAKGLAPENTLLSIQKSIDLAVDEIEVDVRVSLDGVAVLLHDSSLQRVASSHVNIADTTYVELLGSKPDLATLDAAIRLIDRRMPLNIEVKPHQPIDPIVAVLQLLLSEGWRPTDFLLSSKHQPTLRALHDALPLLPTAVIEAWSGVRATYRARQIGSTRLVMQQHFIWIGFIRAVTRRGYQLVSYTLNDPIKAKRWQKHGLYGVVTDFPDRFID